MTTASMLLTAALLAHSGSLPPHHQTSSMPNTVTFPSKLTAGDQFYQGNISGFRRYLDSIQQTDLELFLLVDPHLRKLEDQQRFAWGLGLAGISAGTVMAGTGAVMFANGMNANSLAIHRAALGDLPALDDRPMKDGLTLSGAGVLVMVGSIFAVSRLVPSTDQFLDVINLHNRARPERPMRLQLGFAPVTQGHGGVAVALATF